MESMGYLGIHSVSAPWVLLGLAVFANLPLCAQSPIVDDRSLRIHAGNFTAQSGVIDIPAANSGNVIGNAGGTLRLSEATGSHVRVGEITTIVKHGTTPVTGVDDKVGNVSITARDIELIGAAEIGSASFVDVDEPFAKNPDHSPSGDVNVTAQNSLLIDSARPANSQNSGVTGATPGIFSQFPGETKV